MYYPCNENKGADQLRGYREADLRLCFRICKKNGFLTTRLICFHGDDFLHAGDELLDSVMSKLRKRFSAGKVEEKCFDYIGFKVIQDSDSLLIIAKT